MGMIEGVKKQNDLLFNERAELKREVRLLSQVIENITSELTAERQKVSALTIEADGLRSELERWRMPANRLLAV